MSEMTKIRFILATIVSLVLTGASFADWQAVEKSADGQKVHWYAWGGGDQINQYIQWVAQEVKARHNVDLTHVKVDDTTSVVSQVLAEKTAGKNAGGAVDLVWINGENFAAMKRNGLLQEKSWAPDMPNFRFVDVEGKPTTLIDFTIPTDGLESPWGMAQLIFIYDTAHGFEPPKSSSGLLNWAKKNPGRFSYPQPPNFHGTTFLKQILIETIEDKDLLTKPVTPETFKTASAPLFAYLDQLHPHLWRKGRAFPKNDAAMINLLADGEVEIAFSFNPSAASNAIANGDLPDTVRSFVFETGTLANAHFVAIPFNANAAAGAKIVANFLISPLAQARKQDPSIWGDPTVLSTAKLSHADQKLFEELDLGIATLTPAELGTALDEPHPSWVGEIEKAWKERYEAQ